jgi:Mce-associated membrane protein
VIGRVSRCRAANSAPQTADEESFEPVDHDSVPERPRRARRILVFGLMPAVAIALGAGAGVLKWRSVSDQQRMSAESESVQAAQNATVALLSYAPGTVDQQLPAARDLLTGSFRDAYTTLTNNVVIPGAKQKQISTVATVPAAASVSASADHAVVLVFIDQEVTMKDTPPTGTQSTVKVTMDKVGRRWLVSGFDPI